jgi:hypothetical protein
LDSPPFPDLVQLGMPLSSLRMTSGFITRGSLSIDRVRRLAYLPPSGFERLT